MGKLTDGIVGGSVAPLRPGEARTVLVGEKAITILRSPREYVNDLCDAYNAAMSHQARERGLEWFVTPAGELKLGDNAAWSRRNRADAEQRRETERARYARHHRSDHQG